MNSIELYGDYFDIYKDGNLSDGTPFHIIISENNKIYVVFVDPFFTHEQLRNAMKKDEWKLPPSSFGVTYNKMKKQIVLSTAIIDLGRVEEILSEIKI